MVAGAGAVPAAGGVAGTCVVEAGGVVAIGVAGTSVVDVAGAFAVGAISVFVIVVVVVVEGHSLV